MSAFVCVKQESGTRGTTPIQIFHFGWWSQQDAFQVVRHGYFPWWGSLRSSLSLRLRSFLLVKILFEWFVLFVLFWFCHLFLARGEA